MTTMMANGQLRKSLAEQIDRLEQILNGLANGLNEAVAGAVKEAVQQAVQGVIVEVMTNPQLVDLVRKTLGTPATNPQPASESIVSGSTSVFSGLWNKVKTAAMGTVAFACGKWARVRGWCAVACGAVGGLVLGIGNKLGSSWHTTKHFKVPVLTASVIGVLCGLIAYSSGPQLAAFMGWLAGFTTTLAVQGGLWLRKFLYAGTGSV